MEDIFEFAKLEHERQVKHYGVKENDKTKYTMFAKLVEEVGELSQALLMQDSLQRDAKLKENKESIEDELSDVLLVTLILSVELSVDIKKSLTDKISKIKARKY